MVLLWLYGLAMVAALLMAVRWGQLAGHRLLEADRPTFLLDVFALVRTGLALEATGLVAGFMQRTAREFGVDLVWLHVVAIVLIVCGLTLLLRASGLDRSGWAWRTYLLAGVAWTALVAVLAWT